MAIHTLVFSSSVPKRVWAGDSRGILWRSDDAGIRWDAAGKLKLGIRCVLTDLRLPNVLLAATDDGIFFTKDGGGKWATVFANAKPGSTAAIVSPRNTNLLLVASAGKLQRSDDAGRRWRTSGEFLGEARGFSFHRKGGVSYFWTSTELFRSDNDGASWLKQSKFVSNVFQDPLRDNRWYGLDAEKPMLDDGSGFLSFGRSLANGEEGKASLLIGGSDFVAIAGKTGIFSRTVCGVDDWSPIERFSGEGPGGSVTVFAVDPNNWKSWLAADDKGLWRTEDVAKNWSKVADIR